MFALILFFFGFFFRVAVFLALRNFVRLMESIGFILVKIRASNERVRFGARLRLFVLGFHQACRQRDGLFIAECLGCVAARFR